MTTSSDRESAATATDAGERVSVGRIVLVALPLVVFLGFAGLFFARLHAGDVILGFVYQQLGRDADAELLYKRAMTLRERVSQIPSALIGHDAPALDLPPVTGLERDGHPVPGIAAADFKGGVTVVNVWASWCVPCHDEAPLLVELARDPRFRLVGINYKDQPDNARRFLGRYGNPFAAAGADTSGRAGIEWGVYGVPETFVIGRDGRIAYKLVGPVTPDNVKDVLTPEIEKALAGS